MGHDHPSAWAHLKRPLWQCLNPLDAAANNLRLQQHGTGGHHLHTERWVFAAAHLNPLKQQQGGAPGGVIPSALGISSLVVPQANPAFSRPIITSTDVQATMAAAGGGVQERKFLIFDQSGTRTTMIFSSVSPALQLNGGTATTTTTTTDVKQRAGRLQADAAFQSDLVVNRSDETTQVSQGSKRSDGANEETDDIDALLYSDSEEEEGNAGPCCFPDKISLAAATAVQVEEEVASSGGPSKRRRRDDEKMHDDEALMDTASSTTKADGTTTTSCYPDHATTHRDAADDSDQSSCVKGSSLPAKAAAGCASAGGSSSMLKVKRDHIRETVNVLRGIIPGCKGKDACLVLDEAIRYLKSLELKVQTLGGTL